MIGEVMHLCCLHRCGEFNRLPEYIQFYARETFSLLPFAIQRFPFDIKKPLGYSVAMGVEGFVGLTGLLVISSVVTMAIDCFIYVTTATKDLIRMLEGVNRDAERAEGRPRIFKQLCEFIEFHSELRQLSICPFSSHPTLSPF